MEASSFPLHPSSAFFCLLLSQLLAIFLSHSLFHLHSSSLDAFPKFWAPHFLINLNFSIHSGFSTFSHLLRQALSFCLSHHLISLCPSTHSLHSTSSHSIFSSLMSITSEVPPHSSKGPEQKRSIHSSAHSPLFNETMNVSTMCVCKLSLCKPMLRHSRNKNGESEQNTFITNTCGSSEP